jgi:cell wall assembly regulator SMI1
MDSPAEYREGQRWEFRSNVAEFEQTAIIGRVYPDWATRESRYEVYVRYSPLAAGAVPADADGVVLTLTAAAMDRNVTRLVESDVHLPWWWRYGRRLASEADVPTRLSANACDRIADALPGEFALARQEADTGRRVAESIRRHVGKFGRPAPARPPSRSVAESWDRIRTWLADHARDYPVDLNGGASEATIANFEAAVGAPLPEDFRESVRLHDGGDFWVPPSYGDLLCLDEILDQWRGHRARQRDEGYGLGPDWVPAEIRGPIRPVFWSARRLFVTDNSGTHLTLDLDPPAGGAYGQVLYHNAESGPTEVLAPSWGGFLGRLARDLEEGRYVYFDWGALEPLEWHTAQPEGPEAGGEHAPRS